MKQRGFAILFLTLFMVGFASATYFSLPPQAQVQADVLALGDPWSTLWMESQDVAFNTVSVTVGAVFVAGTTQTQFDIVKSDVILIKFTPEGEQVWNQTWNTPHDEAAHALATATDALYLAGMTTTGPFGVNGLLVKLDFNGNEIWNVSYGRLPAESFTCLVAATDGIYAGGIVNYSGSDDVDALLVKFDFDGTELWNETWDMARVDRGLGVALGSDGVYMVGDYGAQWDGATNNAFLVKYSFTGIQMWNRTYGGLGQETGRGVSVFNDTIYVTGSTESYSSTATAELFLSKYNNTGSLLWSREDAIGTNHQGIAVKATENLIFVGGEFENIDSGCQLSFLCYNDSGDQNFIRVWGGAGPCQPTNLALAIDSIYFSGFTHSWLTSYDNGFLVKFSLDGESAPGLIAITEITLLNPYGSFVVSWTTAVDPDGTIEDYELQMDTSPLFDRPDITWVVNATNLLITNRPVGTYYFRVRARDNTDLYGSWSNVASVTVTLIPPTLFNPWMAPIILLLATLVITAILLFVVIRRWRLE